VQATHRNAIYFLIGTLVGRASGLALIPLYLLVLTPAEAGAWAMLGVLRTLVSAAATFGLDGYLTQEHWRRAEAERAGLAATVLRTVLRWNLLLALPLIPLMAWEPARLWVLTWLGAQAAAMVAVKLAQLRIAERAQAHCALICLVGGGGAALAAILAWAGLGVAGLAIGFAAPSLLAAAIVWFGQAGTRSTEHGLAAYVRRILPARIVAEVAGQADRMVLACVLTEHLLGLYDLAARCAGAIGMLLSSAKNAILPAMLRSLASGGDITGAWRSWRQTQWLAMGASIGLVAIGLVAAGHFPDHPWLPALAFLPGTLSLSLWTHSAMGNAAAIYHHRLIGLQAWLPLTSLVLVVGGSLAAGTLIGWTAVPWGAAAGLAVVTLVTAVRLRRMQCQVAGSMAEFGPLLALGAILLASMALMPHSAG
jgi:O-antigen/teichoic acid export membrane protein